MGMKFKEHADALGTVFLSEEVVSKEEEGVYKKVITKTNVYITKTVILALGASHAMLQVPGEAKLAGAGVSYCATCDGAFFRDRIVAVVGGGDVALEDAIFLSRICKKVILIHRRDTFRGAAILQEKVMKAKNIEVIWSHRVEGIQGDEEVSSILLKNVETEESKSIEVEGVFVAIGIHPNTDWIKTYVECNEAG